MSSYSKRRSGAPGRLPPVPRQTAADIVALLGPLRTGQPPAGPYAQVSSGNYRRMSHEVLRQRHAEDAARRPDAAATYEKAGSVLHLWVKRGPDDAEWVALVTSVGRPGGITLNAGYRVAAESAEEAAELAADPARALAKLVAGYGVSYYSGTKRVYFLPEHVLQLSQPLDRLGPAEFARAVALEEPPDGAQVAVNVALSSTSDGGTRLSWFFVLDLSRYARDAAARRR